MPTTEEAQISGHRTKYDLSMVLTAGTRGHRRSFDVEMGAAAKAIRRIQDRCLRVADGRSAIVTLSPRFYIQFPAYLAIVPSVV